jgi:predicted nucleotidyltransferase
MVKNDIAIPLIDRLAYLPAPVREDLLKARDILARNGATKIILYGSMARGDFHAGSDIDLCVEGLPGISYFHAVGECLRDIESPVSIVPLQNTWGYFRQRILQEGKVIYEQ